MRKGFIFLFVLLLLPGVCMAQGTNSGATVTATFVAKAPVIDGKVSSGEWDSAGIASGDWSAHDSTTLATLKTTVHVCYSIDALYLLYECEDPNVQSLATGTEYYQGLTNVDGNADSTFGWAGETDYVSFYVDPADYADGLPNADEYSYSIQWEPSITAKGEKDKDGNSYNFTEAGRWGSFQGYFNPPLTDKDGNTIYWGSGTAWQPRGIQIVDGPTSTGYVCEVKIPWGTFNGYWRRFMEDGVDLGDSLRDIFVNKDASDPYLNQWGAFMILGIADDGSGSPIGTGIVTGMPMEGTVWKAQFCRYSNGDLGYANWVGDTSGFVSRPFGDIVFGPASASAVEDALLH